MAAVFARRADCGAGVALEFRRRREVCPGARESVRRQVRRLHRYWQEAFFLAVVVGFSAWASWQCWGPIGCTDPAQMQGHKLTLFLHVLAGPLNPFVFHGKMVAQGPVWPVVYLLMALAPWAYRASRKRRTWLSIVIATLLWLSFGWLLAIGVWI